MRQRCQQRPEDSKKTSYFHRIDRGAWLMRDAKQKFQNCHVQAALLAGVEARTMRAERRRAGGATAPTAAAAAARRCSPGLRRCAPFQQPAPCPAKTLLKPHCRHRHPRQRRRSSARRRAHYLLHTYAVVQGAAEHELRGREALRSRPPQHLHVPAHDVTKIQRAKQEVESKGVREAGLTYTAHSAAAAGASASPSIARAISATWHSASTYLQQQRGRHAAAQTRSRKLRGGCTHCP